MLWTKILHMFVGGTLIVAQSMPDPMQTQSSMEELLSYECAKSVATMVFPEDQSGPVFSADGLVFTSIEANNNSRFLIVSAGAGTFSIPLAKAGLNRLHFSIPAHGSTKPKDFYLGFLHDTVTRSRFFDFSSLRPPVGKEESDYSDVIPFRAENLLPNLEYKIHETAETLLASLTEGKIIRSQVRNQKAENCEHITRKAPVLGMILKRNMDVVEIIAFGPKNKSAKAIAATAMVSSRAPASIASVRKP